MKLKQPVIGFIGLGIMGTPMAANLLTAQYPLFLNTRSSVPAELVQQGGVVCATPGDVARQADVIFLMLPDTPDVERVLFGEGGVAAALVAGKTVVDCSSIDPIATRTFAQKIAALGCDYLDAPVSGGQVGARAASLSIMVGGTEDAFARIRPLFEVLGKNITHVGAVGAGQICKVANQMIVAMNLAAVSEALVFASKAGADPARVRAALMGGFASSRILEVHGERMLKRTFAPGFRISLHQKDLGLALQTAKALNIGLPQTAGVAQLMQTCSALGHDQADHSALVLALEHLSLHSLTSDGAAGAQ